MVGLALVVVNAFIVDMLNAFVGVIYACSQRPPSRGPSRLDRAFAGDFILEWHLRLAATFVYASSARSTPSVAVRIAWILRLILN